MKEQQQQKKSVFSYKLCLWETILTAENAKLIAAKKPLSFQIMLGYERNVAASPSDFSNLQIHKFSNSLNSALTGLAKFSTAMCLKHLLC